MTFTKFDKAGGRRTICEVHREIYDIIFDEVKNENVRKVMVSKLSEAFGMAKRMDKKLRYYAKMYDDKKYDDGWWEDKSEEAIEETLERRSKRNG